MTQYHALTFDKDNVQRNAFMRDLEAACQIEGIQVGGTAREGYNRVSFLIGSVLARTDMHYIPGEDTATVRTRLIFDEQHTLYAEKIVCPKFRELYQQQPQHTRLHGNTAFEDIRFP